MARRLIFGAVALVASTFSSCVGAGEGALAGTAHVPVCELDGPYDLHPNFFSANRNGNAFWVRIQNGGGQAEYTDGLWVAVDDTAEVARAIASSTERDADGNPVATFPVGPRGIPGVIVHATLTLDWSCGRHKVTRLGFNVGLWAYEGTMTFRAIDQGPGVEATTAVPDPRLTDVSDVHLRLHDPRPVGPNAPHDISADTPIGDAEINGHFRFHYSRQVPAQFFP
jgi:hypothetical protein